MLISELFEAAYWRQADKISHGAFLDLIDGFADGIRNDPKACGEPHPSFPEGNVWVYETPPVARLPKMYFLYEIDEEGGQVLLWNFKLISER